MNFSNQLAKKLPIPSLESSFQNSCCLLDLILSYSFVAKEVSVDILMC